MNNQKTRRRFLGEASCASVGSIAALSSILNLKLTANLAADEADSSDDYKALVCVFLAGGNDSFNMLVPAEGTPYQDYVDARGAVALKTNEVSSFSAPMADGRKLGLHHLMSGLHQSYEAGNVAFVGNVGTLVERTSLPAITNGTASLPLGLFSHSDQQLHWQSSLPSSRSAASGWGGRLADFFRDTNGASGVSMNISTAGTNLFQGSSGTSVFSKIPGSLPGLKNWDAPTFAHRQRPIESVLDAQYQNLFEKAFANGTKDAIAASAEFRAALEAAPDIVAAFTANNPLSSQLKDVAETIAARDGLARRRQTFFVKFGGWDHHSSLVPHGPMLAQLSQAVGEFQAAMVELGLEDQVTLFTASDFGRTLSANGGGSDHAWGGNQFVVGGAVNGGTVYGEYPDLALGNPLDSGRGRLIPTTSVDEYFAELALWMGVPKSSLQLILPNIGRFYDQTSSAPPLGLMNS